MLDTLGAALWRLAPLIALFVIVASLEWRRPTRALARTRIKRWSHNFALVLVNNFVLRLLFPTASVGVAWYAQQYHWGLLAPLPSIISVPLNLVLLDLAIYWQHRMMHRVPWLWRLHRVHHADTDFDVSTGLRFHPLEILFSLAYKAIVIVMLGATPMAVVLFEVLITACSIFNHANISLAANLEQPLRRLLVTPDMHRVHHSVRIEEHNSNFGFSISCWDRLFASYCAQPLEGHRAMKIGLARWRSDRHQTVWAMLVQPFKKTDN